MAIPAFATTPFQGLPANGSLNLAATGVSAATRVLPDPKPSTNPELRQLRLANLHATEVVFIAWGDSTIATATATGMAIPAGDVEVITIGLATHLAVITGGVAVTLNVTPGGGV